MTEEAHSRLFAPSAAHRWMNCTASSQAAAHYKDVPGEAAMEGTAAHWLLERCLVDGTEAKSFLGRTITVEQDRVKREFIVDRDMATDVQIGIDAVREIALRPGISRVEVTARLPQIDPELFGRVDIWHFGHDGWLTIMDYKHGRNDVSPERNPQEMIYALGVFHEHIEPMGYLVPGVRLVVAQPRSLVPGPRVKQWTCTLDELLAFEDDVRVAVRFVRHQPTFKMGSWCKYCPALGACPESQEQRRILSHVLAMTDLGPAEAAKVLLLEPLLKKKLDDAKAVAKEALLRGQPVEGFGLFTGKKFRQWRDEERAKDELVEVVGISALNPPTPAQAEKLGADAKSVVDRLAFTPPGEPTVAPIGSKLAPYVAKSASEMFGG